MIATASLVALKAWIAIKIQAGQDVRRKANAVFVLTEVAEPARILGDHTLSAMAMSQGDVPEAARKHTLAIRS